MLEQLSGTHEAPDQAVPAVAALISQFLHTSPLLAIKVLEGCLSVTHSEDNVPSQLKLFFLTLQIFRDRFVQPAGVILLVSSRLIGVQFTCQLNNYWFNQPFDSSDFYLKKQHCHSLTMLKLQLNVFLFFLLVIM